MVFSIRRPDLLAGAWLLLAAVSAADAGDAAAQEVPARSSADGSAAICPAEEVRMHTLLEKTIFQVDVLTLDVCFGMATDAGLDSLARDRGYTEARADSVAAMALAATEAGARIEFVRDVGLGRFLDGIRENMGKARDAGILTATQYDSIASGLPGWYRFLRGRDIREGDQMIYRIRGDTLRTVFRAADGRVLLDERYVGAERRLSVLGSYFAPGSDFREGLIRGLLEGGPG